MWKDRVNLKGTRGIENGVELGEKSAETNGCRGNGPKMARKTS